jgi:hypothetical protein
MYAVSNKGLSATPRKGGLGKQSWAKKGARSKRKKRYYILKRMKGSDLVTVRTSGVVRSTPYKDRIGIVTGASLHGIFPGFDSIGVDTRLSGRDAYHANLLRRPTRCSNKERLEEEDSPHAPLNKQLGHVRWYGSTIRIKVLE